MTPHPPDDQAPEQDERDPVTRLRDDIMDALTEYEAEGRRARRAAMRRPREDG